MLTEIRDWAPDPPDLPIEQEGLHNIAKTCHEEVKCRRRAVDPETKYDKLKKENEQLRRLLHLLLADSAGDVPEKLNEIRQHSTAAGAPPSPSVFNVDMRGSNITDVGRDIHNHAHYQWALINLSDGNTIIAILVIFFE